MKTRPVESVAELKTAVETLRKGLSQPETEDSWDDILRSIQSLAAICQTGACEFPADLIRILRSLSRPLTNSMVSERTRLSGTAIDLVVIAASGLGSSFDPLVPVFLPVLLSLCGRANKVIIIRARTCITTIIETTQLPSILPYFLQSIKDKSTTLRLAAAEGTLTCMNCFNPLDLEKETRARDVEAIVRATATDAQADVRAVSRKIFDAYKLLLPGRVESFTAPLTPTIRKYLDIKASNPLSHPAFSRSTPTFDVKSTSSSMSNTSTQCQQPQGPATHVRSVSSTSASAAHTDTGTNKPIRQASFKKQGSEMPPPQYLPVRLAQPSGRGTSVSRTTSSTDNARALVLPLVRPRVPTTRSASSSGLPARTASVASVNAPHRPQQHISVLVPQEQSGGPRRILIPDAPPQSNQRQRVNSTSASAQAERLLTRSLSSEPKGTRSRTPAAALGNTTKPSASQSSSISVKVLPEKASRLGGITQPTLSQLSRAKATAKEKVLPAAPPKAHTWGRPPPQNGKALVKSSLNRQTGQKMTARSVSQPGTGNADMRPITPAEIPLPPSSTPSPHSAAIDVESILTEPLTLSAPIELPVDASAPAECLSKTPISALLSSIQRGFLFTPSSPLSPPELYLGKGPVVNDLPVPFPLSSDYRERAKLAPSKEQFMFGIGVGDLERTTLGNVENLDI